MSSGSPAQHPARREGIEQPLPLQHRQEAPRHVAAAASTIKAMMSCCSMAATSQLALSATR